MTESIALIFCKYRRLSLTCLEKKKKQPVFDITVRRDLLRRWRARPKRRSFVSLLSLSWLFICTLSAGFIRHPCPALFTSYFLYYSLSTFWRQLGRALEPRLSSSDYHFCVISGLCLTQIKSFRPLYKWYVPTTGPGYHILSSVTFILFQAAINGKTSPYTKLGLIIPLLIF